MDQPYPNLDVANGAEFWAQLEAVPPAPDPNVFPRDDWTGVVFGVPCAYYNGNLGGQAAWAARKASFALHVARRTGDWGGATPLVFSLAVADKVFELRDHARAVRYAAFNHLSAEEWHAARDAETEVVTKAIVHGALQASFQHPADASAPLPAHLRVPLSYTDLGYLRPRPADMATFGYYTVGGSVSLDPRTYNDDFERDMRAELARPRAHDHRWDREAAREGRLLVSGVPPPEGYPPPPAAGPGQLQHVHFPDSVPPVPAPPRRFARLMARHPARHRDAPQVIDIDDSDED